MVCKLALYIIVNTFLLAAAMKIIDRHRFFRQMEALFHIPYGLAWGIPACEFACGLGNMINPAFFSKLALVFTVVFLIVVIWLLKKHAHQACHCFGAFSDTEVGVAEVVRNSLLVILALLACSEHSFEDVSITTTLVLYLLSFGFVIAQIQVSQIAFCAKRIGELFSNV